MPLPKPLTRDDIMWAMKNTRSNRAAARFINCSYSHYKKYAKIYFEFEGGQTLFDARKNPSGKGIPKFISDKSKIGNGILDVVHGKTSPKHFEPEKLKNKIFEAGLIAEKCNVSGFEERRVVDGKIPLLVDFKDSNPSNYLLSNLRFLCYNCYFLQVGDIFTRHDIKKLETYEPISNTTKATEFELDEYQIQRLIELGLEPKPPEEEDGYEFVSRL